MHWSIDFDIKPSPAFISIRKPVVLLGSCFAESIFEKFIANKFHAYANPNGILFNPLSIAQSLEDCLKEREIDESRLFQSNGLWHSWDHHGSFTQEDKAVLKKQILTARKDAHQALTDAEWIIITLGSAWVYELKESGLLVANCHKVPQAQFTKRLLSADEIVVSFDQLLQSEQMKKKKILFTVSPVRYIRDGVIENNRSKANLIQAVHELCGNYANAYYFPAYEIVIDELRDYRFYEEDLVHPNQLAIDYVWQRFSETYFDEETKHVLKLLQPVLSATHHRPIHPDTQQHTDFKRLSLEKLLQLEKQYPFLNLETEKLLLQ